MEVYCSWNSNAFARYQQTENLPLVDLAEEVDLIGKNTIQDTI